MFIVQVLAGDKWRSVGGAGTLEEAQGHVNGKQDGQRYRVLYAGAIVYQTQ